MGSYVDEPVPLSEQLLAYYRETMAVHADDPVLHACLTCKKHRCPDWRFAWERLACAGALPAHEQQLDDPPEDGRGQPAGLPLAPAHERTDDLCRR